MSIYYSSYPAYTSGVYTRSYPVATSVIRQASPVRTAVRAWSPVRTSVIRQASPVRTSVIRHASPIRAYATSVVSPIRSYTAWASPVRTVCPWVARSNVVVDPVTRIVGDGTSTAAQVDLDGQEYAKEVQVDDDADEQAAIFESLEDQPQIVDDGLLADAQPQPAEEQEADIQVVNLDEEQEAETGGQVELSNHGDDEGEEVNADPVVEDN